MTCSFTLLGALLFCFFTSFCRVILLTTKKNRLCFTHIPYFQDHSVGLVVKASASRVTDLGLIPAFGRDLFLGGILPVTSNW